jgi:hypothetical protein
VEEELVEELVPHLFLLSLQDLSKLLLGLSKWERRWALQ